MKFAYPVYQKSLNSINAFPSYKNVKFSYFAGRDGILPTVGYYWANLQEYFTTAYRLNCSLIRILVNSGNISVKSICLELLQHAVWRNEVGLVSFLLDHPVHRPACRFRPIVRPATKVAVRTPYVSICPTCPGSKTVRLGVMVRPIQ